MKGFVLLVFAALLAVPAHASTVQFHLPEWSAIGPGICLPRVGVPAQTKHLRAWYAIVHPGETTRFVQFVGLNFPRAGSRDGALMRLSVAVAAGDSYVVRVAIADSMKNWSGVGCGGDAEVRGRRGR